MAWVREFGTPLHEASCSDVGSGAGDRSTLSPLAAEGLQGSVILTQEDTPREGSAPCLSIGDADAAGEVGLGAAGLGQRGSGSGGGGPHLRGLLQVPETKVAVSELRALIDSLDRSSLEHLTQLLFLALKDTAEPGSHDQKLHDCRGGDAGAGSRAAADAKTGSTLAAEVLQLSGILAQESAAKEGGMYAFPIGGSGACGVIGSFQLHRDDTMHLIGLLNSSKMDIATRELCVLLGRFERPAVEGLAQQLFLVLRCRAADVAAPECRELVCARGGPEAKKRAGKKLRHSHSPAQAAHGQEPQDPRAPWQLDGPAAHHVDEPVGAQAAQAQCHRSRKKLTVIDGSYPGVPCDVDPAGEGMPQVFKRLTAAAQHNFDLLDRLQGKTLGEESLQVSTYLETLLEAHEVETGHPATSSRRLPCEEIDPNARQMPRVSEKKAQAIFDRLYKSGKDRAKRRSQSDVRLERDVPGCALLDSNAAAQGGFERRRRREEARPNAPAPTPTRLQAPSPAVVPNPPLLALGRRANDPRDARSSCLSPRDTLPGTYTRDEGASAFGKFDDDGGGDDDGPDTDARPVPPCSWPPITRHASYDGCYPTPSQSTAAVATQPMLSAALSPRSSLVGGSIGRQISREVSAPMYQSSPCLTPVPTSPQPLFRSVSGWIPTSPRTPPVGGRSTAQRATLATAPHKGYSPPHAPAVGSGNTGNQATSNSASRASLSPPPPAVLRPLAAVAVCSSAGASGGCDEGQAQWRPSGGDPPGGGAGAPSPVARRISHASYSPAFPPGSYTPPVGTAPQVSWQLSASPRVPGGVATHGMLPFTMAPWPRAVAEPRPSGARTAAGHSPRPVAATAAVVAGPGAPPGRPVAALGPGAAASPAVMAGSPRRPLEAGMCLHGAGPPTRGAVQLQSPRH